MHNTTIGEGGRQPDPKGYHGTIAFKGPEHLQKFLHVTAHGYTGGKEDFLLKYSLHGEEKSDETPRTPRRTSRGIIEKVVWPKKEDLLEYQTSPIGYSHLSAEARARYTQLDLVPWSENKDLEEYIPENPMDFAQSLDEGSNAKEPSKADLD